MAVYCTSGSVVEYRLAKARVAGSNPVSCLFFCIFLVCPLIMYFLHKNGHFSLYTCLNC